MNLVTRYGQILWVVGSPIEHTLSPIIHNSAFEAESLPHRYFAMEVSEDEISEFMDLFEKMGCLGANFTLPLKESIREFVNHETEAVNVTGAANTLYRDGTRLCVDNTDVHGFKRLVEPWNERIQEESVLVLGAGGAARACLFALGQIDCPKVYLWNRTTRKAESLRDEFEGLEIECLRDQELEDGNKKAPFVVNATSLGLKNDDPSPYPVDQIRSDMVGIDLIYHRETQYMSDFKEHGTNAVGGLKMLVCQAAKAWEHWIGTSPSIDVMTNAARAELRS